MGIFDLFSKIFGKKAQPEALQSASIDVEAMQGRSKALQALQSDKIIEKPTLSEPSYEIQQLSRPVELQKDSLQLGIAAGYTGRSLRDIESSLSRIETNIVTKDWFSSQFEDRTPELIALLNEHDQNEQKRFEALQSALDSLRGIAEKAPEPIKTDLFREITTIEAHLPLTPKMNELFEILKQAKEMSYDELAKRLNLKEISGLRGLLANMTKRTNEIERFEKESKGWVRYTGK